MSVFFKWCLAEELITANPLEGIPRARPEQRTIEPVPEEHVRNILDATEWVTYVRNGNTITQYLPDRYRNRAIILLLLDTGLRASELCKSEKKNLDLERRSLKII